MARFGYSASGFASGDPVNFSDPFGLWSTAAHNALLTHALGGTISAGRLLSLKRASRDADALSHQFPNARHSLANPGQSAEDAIAARETFITGQMNSAKAFAAAGKNPEALAALGMAMHARMDQTSPVHQDENGNPRVFPSSDHSSTDNTGKETSKDITAEQYAENDKNLRKMYNEVFPPKP